MKIGDTVRLKQISWNKNTKIIFKNPVKAKIITNRPQENGVSHFDLIVELLISPEIEKIITTNLEEGEKESFVKDTFISSNRVFIKNCDMINLLDCIESKYL